MANPIFSFTNRDYENARKEGIAKVPSLTNYQWTDLNAGDPGVVLLDYVHALVDMCQFYLDHQALESFLVSAKEISNLFRLAKQVSYDIRSAKGSLVDVKMVLDDNNMLSAGEIITIPKGTEILVTNGAGMSFYTLEEATISGDPDSDDEPAEGDEVEYYSDTVVIPCRQCRLSTEEYIGTGLSNLVYDSEEGGNTDVYENQSYILSSQYPDIDTVEIVGSDGTFWKRVPYIVLESPDSPSYECELLTDGKIKIKFGNTTQYGRSPGDSEVLNISYRSSLGADGNIAPYDINYTITQNSSLGNTFTIRVYNDTAASGGSDVEDVEEIRYHALNHMHHLDRAVTREDFEQLASRVEGIKYVRVYDVRNAPDICSNHEVKIVAIPDNSTENTAVIKILREYLMERLIPPTNLYVMSPSVVTFDVTIVAKKITLELSEDSAEEDIIDIVTNYVNSLNVGEMFNANDIMGELYSIKSIKSILSISTTAPTELSKIQRLSLGTISVSFT